MEQGALRGLGHKPCHTSPVTSPSSKSSGSQYQAHRCADAALAVNTAALIEERSVIERILKHLELPTEGAVLSLGIVRPVVTPPSFDRIACLHQRVRREAHG